MKRILFFLTLSLCFSLCYSQTLQNPATIGQSSRNQKVGDGLQVTDTLVVQGESFFNEIATFDDGQAVTGDVAITGALSATDSLSTAKGIFEWVTATDSITTAWVSATDSVNTPMLIADTVTVAYIGNSGGYVDPAALAPKYALLYSSTTQVGTDANTTEKTLASYTLPANTLDTDGDFIEVRASGSTSASGANKRIELNFGSACMDTGPKSVGAKQWEVCARIYRTGTSAQKTASYIVMHATSAGSGYTDAGSFHQAETLSEDLTSDILISIVGQNGASNINDIILETFTVEYKKQ